MIDPKDPTEIERDEEETGEPDIDEALAPEPEECDLDDGECRPLAKEDEPEEEEEEKHDNSPKPGCPAPHTTYNPSEEEWKCPKCGETPDKGGFYIQEPSEDTDDCGALHTDDGVGCDKCGYWASGKAFAAAVMRKKNLVPCPTCRGHGTIDAKRLSKLPRKEAKPKPSAKKRVETLPVKKVKLKKPKGWKPAKTKPAKKTVKKTKTKAKKKKRR